jgi:ABC-type transporter Mla MlaB component
LRITIHEEPQASTLQLEGRLAGPLVSELDRTWRSLAASLGSKKLLVDLCGITQIDLNGRQVLADIHRGTGAEFVADTPMTKYFAEEARQKTNGIEEET